MNYRKFTRLMIWEFEEFWRSPTLELIIGIAIFFGLSTPAIPSSSALLRANDIESTTLRLTLFQMFIIAILFARSIAGTIEKKEILTFFTYPVKRISVLASKFLVDVSTIFIIFAAVTITRGLLAQLEPWNTLTLIVLFILFLETMFFSSLSLLFSVLTKRTWASILLIIIFFFTVTSFMPRLEAPFKYAIPTNGAEAIFNCLTVGFHDYTVAGFTVALSSILIISIIFILASFIHFKRMQVD